MTSESRIADFKMFALIKLVIFITHKKTTEKKYNSFMNAIVSRTMILITIFFFVIFHRLSLVWCVKLPKIHMIIMILELCEKPCESSVYQNEKHVEVIK